MKYLIFVAIIAIILVYLKHTYLLIKVGGESMLPTLKEGNILLVRKRVKVSKEDIVISRDPQGYREFLVKRVFDVTLVGRVFLLGDNITNSRDSRAFGYVDKELIVGKVVKVWK